MLFLEKKILKHWTILILTYSSLVFEKLDYKIVLRSDLDFSFSSRVFSCNFLCCQSAVEPNSFNSTDWPVCVPAVTIWCTYSPVSAKAGPQLTAPPGSALRSCSGTGRELLAEAGDQKADYLVGLSCIFRYLCYNSSPLHSRT